MTVTETSLAARGRGRFTMVFLQSGLDGGKV
jgi:hypothetical protein